MKRTIAVAVLGAFCGSAFANPTPQPVATATGVGIGVSESKASAGAFAESIANPVATAFGGSGGTGYGGIGVGGTGFGTALSAPTQSIVVQGNPELQTVTHNGRTQVETVPNVYAPNIYPTAPCMGSSSAGAGWLGFGFSGGTSWTDHECQLMEASRNAPTPKDRIYVWCKSESAKGAPSCVGLQPEPTSTTGSIPVERERRVDATVKTGDPRTWGSY